MAELVDPVLVVSVNQSYPKRSAYDAARFAWRVSEHRVSLVEYVLATKNRQIIGVFVPREWKKATKENFPEFDMDLPGRRGFVGTEADGVAKERYLGRYLPPDFEFAGTGMRYAGPLVGAV